ncbi:MAG: hypothetical protein M3121_02990 [Chloroflexota bacterium]|nr:hypothetical protein [Chloroflexota bacterium]
MSDSGGRGGVSRRETPELQGPAAEETPTAQQLAQAKPDMIRSQQATDVRPGSDDKTLHRQMPELSDAELATLPLLAPGTPLAQGSIYLDLDDLPRGPFKAIGGQEAGARIVAKQDADYELWNRLAGRDDEPEIERPAGQE